MLWGDYPFWATERARYDPRAGLGCPSQSPGSAHILVLGSEKVAPLLPRKGPPLELSPLGGPLSCLEPFRKYETCEYRTHHQDRLILEELHCLLPNALFSYAAMISLIQHNCLLIEVL